MLIILITGKGAHCVGYRILAEQPAMIFFDLGESEVSEESSYPLAPK